MKETEYFKNFGKKLAAESGQIIRHYFRKPVSIEIKNDSSPVTEADKKCEELIRDLILKEFPDHGIIGEEYGIINPDAEYVWVIDPIDGTKSFICGALSFGTLIALMKNGNPLFGIFHQPVLKEMLIGDGAVTQLNGTGVRLRKCDKISDAVLLVTDHLNVGKYHDAEKFENLIRKVKLYRNWGDCYGYYLLATGFADIMIDPVMSVWDIMALIPIVRGAGGVITDYYGSPPENGKSLLAAGGSIHSEVLKILT